MPSAVNSTLAGVTSPCTIPSPCATASAEARGAAIVTTSPGSSTPRRVSRAASDPPGAWSSTRTSPTTARSRTTYGVSSRRSSVASRRSSSRATGSAPGRSRFRATTSPVASSRARQTSPVAPKPSIASTSYPGTSQTSSTPDSQACRGLLCGLSTPRLSGCLRSSSSEPVSPVWPAPGTCRRLGSRSSSWRPRTPSAGGCAPTSSTGCCWTAGSRCTTPATPRRSGSWTTRRWTCAGSPRARWSASVSGCTRSATRARSRPGRPGRSCRPSARSRTSCSSPGSPPSPGCAPPTRCCRAPRPRRTTRCAPAACRTASSTASSGRSCPGCSWRTGSRPAAASSTWSGGTSPVATSACPPPGWVRSRPSWRRASTSGSAPGWTLSPASGAATAPSSSPPRPPARAGWYPVWTSRPRAASPRTTTWRPNRRCARRRSSWTARRAGRSPTPWCSPTQPRRTPPVGTSSAAASCPGTPRNRP